MKSRYLASAGLTIIVAAVAAVAFAVSGGSARARPVHATASSSAVTVRTTSVGKTLVDADGRTLYLFKGDTRNVSKLSRAGLPVWPRFIAIRTPKAGKGAHAARLGMVTNPSGVRQVTYNGHPLYYYVGDSKPGSIRGQGLNEFGALWYVLSPAGNAVTHAPVAAKAPTTPAPSSGY